MVKPRTLEGYTDQETLECERVLVALLRRLGPWKESVYLIGGLTPRYLVPARPPEVPPHAGTLDIDVVVDLEMLTNTEAYKTLEDNLKGIGFERSENTEGKKLSWRWQIRTDRGILVVLELLADAPDLAGGKVQPLPIEGTISAVNIPHASIVFEMYQVARIQAELMDDDGVATEYIRHANLVSFVCLKAFAYAQRSERKDAHDLVYCLEHGPQSLNAKADSFRSARDGRHGEVVRKALRILADSFAADGAVEGYRKDGPIAVAKFELGGQDDLREARVLRQRQASEVIEGLLGLIG